MKARLCFTKNTILSLATLEQQMFASARYASQKLEEELERVKVKLERAKNDEICDLRKLQTNYLEAQRILNLSIERIEFTSNFSKID